MSNFNQFNQIDMKTNWSYTFTNITMQNLQTKFVAHKIVNESGHKTDSTIEIDVIEIHTQWTYSKPSKLKSIRPHISVIQIKIRFKIEITLGWRWVCFAIWVIDGLKRE